MVDYRRFLAKTEQLTLPWVGGRELLAHDRSLRLVGRPPARPGWYTFEVKGREGTIVGPAEAPSLAAVPKVRGWLKSDRLFVDGGRVEQLSLLPEEEPPAFSPVVARRWAPSVLLFEAFEFESEAEGACREALGTNSAMQSKAVPAPLRAAYGMALLERVGRELSIRVSLSEVRLKLATVASGGADAAATVLRALEAERERGRRALAEFERQRQSAEARELAQAVREQATRDLQQARAERRNATPHHDDRAAAALSVTGARLESLRRLSPTRLEVVFHFQGERFISIVDADTLQVIDSGICLSGEDDLVTLESLPGVIAEAMDNGVLVITRWP